jgi:hypothetical protein
MRRDFTISVLLAGAAPKAHARAAEAALDCSCRPHGPFAVISDWKVIPV